MNEADNMDSFFRENKKLVKEYLDIRLELIRLRAINVFSRSAGYLLWLIISLMLLLLLAIFGGLVTGFWLSTITGSYTCGFGITTLIILALVSFIAIFRKRLFVNPIIHNIINRTTGEEKLTEKE